MQAHVARQPPGRIPGGGIWKRKMQHWCLQGCGVSGVGDRRWWPPTYACSATLSHAPCNTALHLMPQPTAAIQPHVPDWEGSACRSLAGVPRIVMRPARPGLLGYSSGVWVALPERSWALLQRFLSTTVQSAPENGHVRDKSREPTRAACWRAYQCGGLISGNCACPGIAMAIALGRAHSDGVENRSHGDGRAASRLVRRA